MGLVFRADWGLGKDGQFYREPWFHWEAGSVIQNGFGNIPPGLTPDAKPVRELAGVVIPGLVNAHTHLELSVHSDIAANISYNKPGNVHEFARLLMQKEKQTLETVLESAKYQMNAALKEGTFFFADVANNPDFCRSLGGAKGFQGVRFLELLGFAAPNDTRRIEAAMSVSGDEGLYMAPHSVYGSSPAIMNFIKENHRDLTTIHVLEETAEEGIFNETGITWEFLGSIGQQTRHPEIYGSSLDEYLLNYLGKVRKVLLVHLLSENRDLLQKLRIGFPRAAVVICNRSNRNLGYTRGNSADLYSLGFPLLVGTDSAASTGDVSVIREIADIVSEGVLPAETAWRAATYSAYDFFEISGYPWYLFPVKFPDPGMMAKTPALPSSRWNQDF